MIKIGLEYHSILKNIFGEIKNYQQSNQIQVCCPRCQQRDGLDISDGKFNLEINTEKKVFRCWKCDEPRFSGSLGKLIREFGTRIDYELYKSFASSGVNFTDNEYDDVIISLPKEMIYFSNMDVRNKEHVEAYMYLVNNRKYNREIILKYRMGFCVEGKYRGRIIFPSYDLNGNVNYFVSRLINENNKKVSKYLNPEINKDKIIFNEGLLNFDSTIYLVEGSFDSISLINAVPMLGKTLSSALMKKLIKYKPNIVLLLDPDAYKSSIELYYMLYDIYVNCEDRVKIVKLPIKNNEDIDEIRKKYGNDRIKEILYGARKLNIDDHFEKKLNSFINKKRWN